MLDCNDKRIQTRIDAALSQLQNRNDVQWEEQKKLESYIFKIEKRLEILEKKYGKETVPQNK